MFGRKKSKKEPEERIDIDSAWSEDEVEPFFDGAAADHGEEPGRSGDSWEGESGDGEGSWDDSGLDGLWDDEPEADADLSGLDVFVGDGSPDDTGEDGDAGYAIEEDGDQGASEAVGSVEDDDALFGSASRGYDDDSSRFLGDDDDFDAVPLDGRDDEYDDRFAQDDDFGYDDEVEAAPAPTPAPPAAPKAGGKGGKHAAHAAKPTSKRQQKKEEKRRLLEEMPDHERKSKRQRRGLTIVLVLLLVLVGALVYLAYTFVVTADLQPVQQENDTEAAQESVAEGDAEDSGRTAQKTEVPVLVSLFGMDQDEAIEALGHGATVDSSQDVNEEGSAIKKRVGLKLTEEPGDARSGQPTVYLGLNKDGEVVEASYSTATGYLGYGALSLSDIVENEHIVENTLSDAGLVIEDADLALPDDPSEYQTYDSDGTTLVRERVTFDGSAPSTQGDDYDWSAVITYDYSSANASGNLADTVRQIYVTVKKP